MGNSVKLIGKALNTGKVHEPILRFRRFENSRNVEVPPRSTTASHEHGAIPSPFTPSGSRLDFPCQNTRLGLLDYFLNYLKRPRSRSWEGNYSGRALRSGRNTAGQIDSGLHQQDRGIATGVGRKRILAGTTRRVRIFPGGKTACAKERNRRVERDIR